MAESSEIKTSLSLKALLRAAYERIGRGATAFTQNRVRRPALFCMSERSADGQLLFRPRRIALDVHSMPTFALRGLNLILQPLCNARDGCW